MTRIAELLRTGNATIIDVRTPGEYSGGHVAGSINIPLNELPGRIAELKDKKNIVLCCASGARSGSATMLLQQYGIECANGGSWLDVNYHCNN
jgi:rhodanese-related sulfurtransferase